MGTNRMQLREKEKKEGLRIGKKGGTSAETARQVCNSNIRRHSCVSASIFERKCNGMELKRGSSEGPKRRKEKVAREHVS